jgi:hypothetical protein
LEVVETALWTVFHSYNFDEADDFLLHLDELRRRLGLAVAAHDEFEIIRFARLFHTDQDSRVGIARLRECVTSATSTSTHRVMAANQLLMIADYIRDADLARFAFEASHTSESDDLSNKLRRMMYHTSFADADEALQLAGELSGTLAAYGVPNAPRLVGILLNVGYAHYRVGDPSLSHAYLMQALQHARRNEMTFAEIHILSVLMQLSWSTGEIGECRTWREQLDNFATAGAFTNVVCDYCVIGARLATYEGRREEALDLVARARKHPQASLNCFRTQLLTCEIASQQRGDRWLCSDVQLLELEEDYLRTCTLGGHDDTILILLRTLLARNRAADARALAEAYPKIRRERLPFRPEVADALREATSTKID